MSLPRCIRQAGLLFLAAGCGDGLTDTERLERACASGRRPAQDCVVWQPSAGVYELRESIALASLRIAAGTVVRAAEGVRLTVDTLVVAGSEAEPVIFGPLQSGGTWAGITGPPAGSVPDGTAEVRHARIEGADVALAYRYLTAEDVVIERTLSHGIVAVGAVELARVNVRHAGGLGAMLFSGGRVVDSTIRHSGGGIATGRRSILRIGGGAIEDNAGTGIRTLFEEHLGGSVIFESPVRITRNGGYPLEVPLAALRGLLSDSANLMMLTGNARDTVVLFAAATWDPQSPSTDPVVLRRELPARVHAGFMGPGIQHVIMRPGSTLLIEGVPSGLPATAFSPHHMPQLESTEDEPVTLGGSAIALRIPVGEDTWLIRHAHLHGITLVSDSRPVVLEDVELDSTAIYLTAPGSRLNRVRSRRGGVIGQYPSDPLHTAALTLGDNAIVEHTIIEESRTEGVIVRGANVTIRSCSIRFSEGHGVVIESGSASINGCNLESNQGSGVHNATGTLVDATNNWWGSELGPMSGNGDGATGPVTVEPWSATPHTILPASRPYRFSSRS